MLLPVTLRMPVKRESSWLPAVLRTFARKTIQQTCVRDAGNNTNGPEGSLQCEREPEIKSPSPHSLKTTQCVNTCFCAIFNLRIIVIVIHLAHAHKKQTCFRLPITFTLDFLLCIVDVVSVLKTDSDPCLLVSFRVQFYKVNYTPSFSLKIKQVETILESSGRFHPSVQFSFLTAHAALLRK